ncbi:primosomal protein N' [bacterium]|nr:primosomal protein N' [bacterium]
MNMFNAGDIVKVLIPNAVNTGYDYRLNAMAQLGSYVSVTVMGRPYIGVVYGISDGTVPPEKIKSTTAVFPDTMSIADLQWIQKMSMWTLMPAGAVLRLIINVPDVFAPPRMEPVYIYNTDGSGGRMTDNRQAVADAFAANDYAPMTISDIQNISRVSRTVINTMIKKDFLIQTDARPVQSTDFCHEYTNTGAGILTQEQQAAADTIGTAISDDKFSVHLIDGITGSGKTHVYFDAAWRAYSRGGSVLLMMPEIALTAQFMDRFTKRFGAPPVVWHSNLTAARRREIWRGVLRGDVRMVVGTRSALFLPWKNLRLIVVDEEHDTSYKQEDMGNYHARDMAILRAKIAGFPIILASATPAAETLNNAQNGKYNHLRLTSRFGGASLPRIETIDLRSDRPTEYTPLDAPDTTSTGVITTALQTAIGETLAAGQQTMLFINRRGFAPIVQCKKCGYVATCPDCSVSMTYHKKLGKLLCHMCGRTAPMPVKCPDCGDAISTRGAGMEKIAEEVAAKFPDARIECVSSDTMMSRAALERLVHKMESGETDVIIGTQILAKGHHFPNLTLVGVVDSDMGLFGTDFRAAEHTFQQLFQVAGRAGRGEHPGRVLMQTYQPDHPVLRAICECDRDTFMKNDMDGRRAAKMPPFGQLIALVIEGQKESVLQRFCADLAAAAPSLSGGRIMGPVPAQIYQIRNWYRMRFLISGGATANLQPVVSNWISRVRVPANIRVKIDVGPQNFM